MNDVATPARRSLTMRIPETSVITRWRLTPRIENTWKFPPCPFCDTPGISLTTSVTVATGVVVSCGSTLDAATLTGENVADSRFAVTTRSW